MMRLQPLADWLRTPRARAIVLLWGAIVTLTLSGETESLPNWAFMIDRHKLEPKRGDYFAFVAPPNRYYPPGFRFTKQVVGVPGDLVTVEGRTFSINGKRVGIAKTADKEGRPVEAAPPGIIPAGHYFVITPSPDSLDSRYRIIGLIPKSRLVGQAFPVM
jgi:conjugal transfer pilin signal peptidase TrbI